MDWRDYLHNRGITDEIIEFAEISYQDPWIRIPYFTEPLRPVKGRWFPSERFKKLDRPKYLWLEGSPQFPYMFREMIQGNSYKRLFITEGEFDCLLLRNYYLIRATKIISLPLGVNCWKPEWTRFIGSSITVCALYDNDEAGRRGMKLLANKLQRKIYGVVWPSGFESGGDISDYLLTHSIEYLDKNLQFAPIEPKTIKDDLVVSRRPRFSISSLEEIKSSVPIEYEISKAGIRLKKDRVGYSAHCPWHEDKRPSFFVYKKTNSFYCFSCGRGGSIIDFLKEWNDSSLERVISGLLYNYGNRTTSKKEEGTDGSKNGGAR